MLFNSIDFLIFFPIVVTAYFIIPKKVRYIWLLLASYYFYMSWNAKYALLILFSTGITYASGLIIEKFGRRKLVVCASVILNLGVLFYFKYFGFACALIQQGLARINIRLNIPGFDIILPVGISFYTFQALSYTIDVYRGHTKAEHNFLKYALFVSFFPQLVAGPIERSGNLLRQLNEPKAFDYDKFRDGTALMIWGFFLKIVLADRIAIFVDTVYDEYETFNGLYIVVASMLFAIQIYCDFYGYSVIAKGAAEILGVDIMENFNAPYLSETVSEFWRRWHISLTSWFRDYLYIPLGGSRVGILRKYMNIMIVFLLSGLWHGASLAFVVWGGLNGLFQIIGSIFEPIRLKVNKLLHLHRHSLGHRLVKIIITFVLVDISWVFFRAGRLGKAVDIIRNAVSVRNPWILFDGSIYNCGLDYKNFSLMLICVGILLFADVCKKKGIVIRRVIIGQDYWFRWVFFAVSIFLITLFGIWGSAYNEANFIYFQF